MCNLVYAVLIEGLDEDDRRDLDVRLETAPGETPTPVSRGTNALMAMFAPGGIVSRST